MFRGMLFRTKLRIASTITLCLRKFLNMCWIYVVVLKRHISDVLFIEANMMLYAVVQAQAVTYAPI